MYKNIFKKPDIPELIEAVFDLLKQKQVSEEMQTYLRNNVVDKLVYSSEAKYSMMKSMRIVRETLSCANEQSSKLFLETSMFDLFCLKLLVHKEETP